MCDERPGIIPSVPGHGRVYIVWLPLIPTGIYSLTTCPSYILLYIYIYTYTPTHMVWIFFFRFRKNSLGIISFFNVAFWFLVFGTFLGIEKNVFYFLYVYRFFCLFLEIVFFFIVSIELRALYVIFIFIIFFLSESVLIYHWLSANY